MMLAALLQFAVATPLAAQGASGAVPAEIPPASYSARQYVDSRGCVFVRAGYGTVVSWVPRVSRARKQMCGFAPSLAAGPGAAPAAMPEAPPKPRPDDLPAAALPAAALPATAPAAPQSSAPKSAAAAQGSPRALRQLTARASGGQLGDCPPGKPRLQRYLLSDGRQMLRCAPQAGSSPGDYRILPPAGETAAAVPPGMKPAWSDGRLNPERGPRTAAGDAAMNRVWSDGVPARQLASDAPRVVAPLMPQLAAAAPAGRYVQVGTFGQPDNAARAETTIGRLGLPVARTAGGGGLAVVLAGPFDDPGAARAALRAVRAAGYGDAFVRG